MTYNIILGSTYTYIIELFAQMLPEISENAEYFELNKG